MKPDTPERPEVPEVPEAAEPFEAPEINVQAGVPLEDPEFDETQVATGSRRDEVRYEADPDQVVRMRALSKPEGPIPPEMTTAEDRAFDQGGGEPIEDIQVSPASPSVWDARPPPEEEDRGGNPAGH